MPVKPHYTFDLQFQEHILASFLADEKFFDEFSERVLKPLFFGDEVLRGIAEAVLAFHSKEQELPSHEALLESIKDFMAPGRKLTEYEDMVESVMEKVGMNTAYYQEKALEFARVQLWNTAVRESLVLVEMGDTEAVSGLFRQASKDEDGLSQKKKLYDYFDSIKDRALEYFNLREGKPSVIRVATGFEPLDNVIQGGLGQGELGVIVAPAKHGKTTALVSLASNAILLQKKALYITLELSHKLISSKFDTFFFGGNLNSIKDKPKSFKEKLEQLKGQIQGRLQIAQFPTKSLTLSTLQLEIEKVKPDIVFVDYAQLIKPPLKRGEKRHEISDVYEGLRGVAEECEVPIWTAHQANRPGFGVKVVEMEHIAEDIGVAAIADVIISINQTEDEIMAGQLRFYVAGNRLGPSDKTIGCTVDWSVSRISTEFGGSHGDLS